MKRVLIGPLVCFGIAAVAVAGFFVYREWRSNDEATPTEGIVDVATASASPVGSRGAVIGFVFLDRFTGDLLCSERTKGDRPECKGDVATLEGLDPNRLDLVRSEAKGFDAWSRGPVVLQVTARRSTFTVEDVLPTP